MKKFSALKALKALKAQIKRKNFWLLALIVFLSVTTIFGLVNIIHKVALLEEGELAYNNELLVHREQSDDLAAIQIEFKNQVQEWKDVLLRGHNPELARQYWQQFEQSEASVRTHLEELRDELLVVGESETQLSDSAFPLTSHQQLKKLQQQSLTKLHFVEKLSLIIDGHIQIGKIYREFLARYPLSLDEDNAFEIDKNVRGIDRWMSAQLAAMHTESVADQNAVISKALDQQQRDIRTLRIDIQRSIAMLIGILIVNLLLLFDRLRTSSQELDDANKQSEANIYELAYSDGLTGLPNRRLFNDKLDQAIALSSNTGEYGGLIFLDLDNFKTLNDTKGHAQGDLLLIEVAQRLRNSVRATDTVARLGGDEFVVILDALRGDMETATEHAGVIAEKICIALNQPYHLKTYTHHGGASLGVALFNRGEINSEELLKRADTAMYQAKRAGRNTVRFYDEHIQNALEARSDLEHSLHVALEDKQFELYYQVQVNQYKQPIGAEALLRWHHPELGMLYPTQFIALAEESDLIITLGSWVLHTACAQIKRWEASPHTRDLVLSINVSGAQLRKSKHVTKHSQTHVSTAKLHKPNFIEQVQQALLTSNINPARLKLEITESMALHDIEYTIETLLHLKALGVSLSMDDFGTGHSSLTHLKRMPLDQIKIDQSFVQEIDTDTYDKAIVKSMIDMAASMRISILAEGVETQAQEDALISQGCLSFQGHLFGKPLPVQEFEIFLKP